MNSSVLLVEDDVDLSYIIKFNLESAGYNVETAYNGMESMKMVKNSKYDLILLDVLLPDTNGTEICRHIRHEQNTPIIFVSCIDDKEIMIEALEKGGDDYIVKPVDYAELIARIEANIRRVRMDCRKYNRIRRLSFKQFSVDIDRRVVRNMKGEEIELSPTEYQLLLKFIRHQGELLSYNDLYSSIWESDSLGDIRTVMVHISNLRKKIDSDKTGVIETVRGAGYIFDDK
jgi:DNA-binding response OmpR family regulator